MPAEQSKSAENNSKMHGVLLFFYARLFRKLAGLLEAPYKSPINPTKPQLSHREAQLIWITVAREIIAKQFPIDQHPVEFHLIAKFDEFDTPQLSHREAQLIWITVAREIIAKQFPIDQHPLEFHLIAKFDEFDTVPEQLLLAEIKFRNPLWLTGQTLALPSLFSDFSLRQFANIMKSSIMDKMSTHLYEMPTFTRKFMRICSNYFQPIRRH
uniref:HORMA domain-containing protein n=1 Tax=Globodera pallida TaxID=36090 RepID=A0A183BIZ9_GLOPA